MVLMTPFFLPSAPLHASVAAARFFFICIRLLFRFILFLSILCFFVLSGFYFHLIFVLALIHMDPLGRAWKSNTACFINYLCCSYSLCFISRPIDRSWEEEVEVEVQL